MTTTPEQSARDMLERMGIENAQNFTAGDVVELANLIAEKRATSPASEPLTAERLEALETTDVAQIGRNLLEDMEVPDAQEFTAGQLSLLQHIIAGYMFSCRVLSDPEFPHTEKSRQVLQMVSSVRPERIGKDDEEWQGG